MRSPMEGGLCLVSQLVCSQSMQQDQTLLIKLRSFSQISAF
uniref:F12G12.18 n=1 Tax=Arabidopsis thaliana TaxID=3702 RepID=Q9FPG9_ARATH|nr:F12G12.18 [Arabidopsis thaliana]